MTTLDHALRYLAAGFSVVPISPGGSKKPPQTWKEYQRRLATEDEARRWWADNRFGVAIICGKVSGGLEVLDFDSDEVWQQFLALSEEEMPGFLAKLPQVETPAGGRHLYYRLGTLAPRGNTKLARDTTGETLAETRGEGGYVLAPGSPAACHESGRYYLHAAGPPIEQTPVLSDLLATWQVQ